MTKARLPFRVTSLFLFDGKLCNRIMAEIASSRSKRRVLVALAQVPSAVSKLGRMSKRELDDFGIAGSEIANIARDSLGSQTPRS
ncbi:uncharacterized protein YjiS (DUF1127 family) [Rhizobium sp. BK661]|nr:uncharacterized protein YjiS (DUF1127 family) [Rhizobium sp. BK661]